MSPNRAVSLSISGPGISAAAIFCPPIPNRGNMEIVRRMIPIPPSHPVMTFQRTSDFGIASSPRHVHPVVVHPAQDSKKQAMKE